MRARTLRQFALQGSTPSGWHVQLPDGDFGFHDIQMPTNASEHLQLIAAVRESMRALAVRACLFVTERELADGRPVLYLQYEAVSPLQGRRREIRLVRIAAGPQGRYGDETETVTPSLPADVALLRDGLFPDLLPDPPSPLRIL